MTIKSWTNTLAGTYAGVSGRYYFAKGYQYRMVSDGFEFQDKISVEYTTEISEIKIY